MAAAYIAVLRNYVLLLVYKQHKMNHHNMGYQLYNQRKFHMAQKKNIKKLNVRGHQKWGDYFTRITTFVTGLSAIPTVRHGTNTILKKNTVQVIYVHQKAAHNFLFFSNLFVRSCCLMRGFRGKKAFIRQHDLKLTN